MNGSTPRKLALRLREAAQALGICERTLWQMAVEGKVPCARIGEGKRKTLLFPLAELQTWLAQQVTKPEGGE